VIKDNGKCILLKRLKRLLYCKITIKRRTGKPIYMRLIRAMSVPYISKPHILKLKTNGKDCNSSMMFGTFVRPLNFGL
jgi:hypothetical protein